jgi:RNA polymerase sigma-70 factor, ECF subfamily
VRACLRLYCTVVCTRPSPKGGHVNIPDSEDLQRVRSYLLRYARLQLRDPGLAEDAVQDTLLAAFEHGDQFSGKSAYKSWLVGILKNKIIDVIRRKSREQPLVVDEDPSESEIVDGMFEAKGQWRQLPSGWGNPERALEDKKFWETLERCLELMPERTARVFAMREVMELSGDEICGELAITQANLWVMLHRARLSLRKCLETRWFGSRAK